MALEGFEDVILLACDWRVFEVALCEVYGYGMWRGLQVRSLRHQHFPEQAGQRPLDGLHGIIQKKQQSVDLRSCKLWVRRSHKPASSPVTWFGKVNSPPLAHL